MPGLWGGTREPAELSGMDIFGLGINGSKNKSLLAEKVPRKGRGPFGRYFKCDGNPKVENMWEDGKKVFGGALAGVATLVTGPFGGIAGALAKSLK